MESSAIVYWRIIISYLVKTLPPLIFPESYANGDDPEDVAEVEATLELLVIKDLFRHSGNFSVLHVLIPTNKIVLSVSLKL